MSSLVWKISDLKWKWFTQQMIPQFVITSLAVKEFNGIDSSIRILTGVRGEGSWSREDILANYLPVEDGE